MSWRRGCGPRWARAWCSRREAATRCAWPRTTSTPSASRRSSGAAGASSRPASRGRRRRRCGRHSRSGAARRWRTSATSASRSPRSRVSRTCVSPASAIAWMRIWPAARHAEVVGELEALVLEHPLRERLRGQQMLALYRCGRQADALEAYRSTYEALVDGLGIEPSPDLRALEAAILRQEVPAPVRPQAPAARIRRRRRREAPRDVRVRAAHAIPARGAISTPSRCARCSSATTTRPAQPARGTTAAWPSCATTPCCWSSERRSRTRTTRSARSGRRPSSSRGRSSCRSACARAAASARARSWRRRRRDSAAPVIGEAVGAAERLARAGVRRRDPDRPRDLAARAPRRTRLSAARRRLPAGRHRRRCPGDQATARPPADRPRGRSRAPARRRFARVAELRTPALMTILGEPGIGKSHLAAELAAIAGDGARVLDRPLPGVWREHHVLAAARDRPAGPGRLARSTRWRLALGIAPSVAAPGRGRRWGSSRARRARTPAGHSCA